MVALEDVLEESLREVLLDKFTDFSFGDLTLSKAIDGVDYDTADVGAHLLLHDVIDLFVDVLERVLVLEYGPLNINFMLFLVLITQILQFLSLLLDDLLIFFLLFSLFGFPFIVNFSGNLANNVSHFFFVLLTFELAVHVIEHVFQISFCACFDRGVAIAVVVIVNMCISLVFIFVLVFMLVLLRLGCWLIRFFLLTSFNSIFNMDC